MVDGSHPWVETIALRPSEIVAYDTNGANKHRTQLARLDLISGQASNFDFLSSRNMTLFIFVGFKRINACPPGDAPTAACTSTWNSQSVAYDGLAMRTQGSSSG
jgi:hypothetical protein